MWGGWGGPVAIRDSDFAMDSVAGIGVHDAAQTHHDTVATELLAVEPTLDVLDTRTIEILRQRRAFRSASRRRGWLVRRLLLLVDLLALAVAFFVAQRLFEPAVVSDRVGPGMEFVIFLACLPVWVVAAHVAGLYDRDGERTDHSTADDIVGVVAVVTIGTWIVSSAAWLTHLVHPDPP